MIARQKVAKKKNLWVERGEDPSTLLIVFNSGFKFFTEPVVPFEHHLITERMGCSRIHCKDPERLYYLTGLSSECPDLFASAQLLRQCIDELSPQTIIALGSSAGGYAAMVFGHLLEVDYVHAFGPITSLDPVFIRDHWSISLQRWRQLQRILPLTEDTPKLREVPELLAEHNGRTRYFVHYCGGTDGDRLSAKRVEKTPGVRLMCHRCSEHSVVIHLMKLRLLEKMLNPTTQNRVDEILAHTLESSGDSGLV